MQDIKDKVAFVTGGAQGIGYAIARALLEEGANMPSPDDELNFPGNVTPIRGQDVARRIL
jgi:enoyl-[acyl-carrier-protein] reductase (NADH)